MASSKGVRALLLIIMDVFFLVAVFIAARIVVEFFGSLAGATAGEMYVDLTRYIVIPFGAAPIDTPYGGVFDIDATVTVALILGIEWMLGAMRRRA